MKFVIRNLMTARCSVFHAPAYLDAILSLQVPDLRLIPGLGEQVSFEVHVRGGSCPEDRLTFSFASAPSRAAWEADLERILREEHSEFSEGGKFDISIRDNKRGKDQCVFI